MKVDAILQGGVVRRSVVFFRSVCAARCARLHHSLPAVERGPSNWGRAKSTSDTTHTDANPVPFLPHHPQVTPTAAFQGDLGLDSLDAVELVMALEEEFGIEIPDAEADKILSTGEAIAYLSAHPQAK